MSKTYQLRIDLKGIKPPVWRRVKIIGNVTFSSLHAVIQVVMGWEDCHLYEFKNSEYLIGNTPEDSFFPGTIKTVHCDDITIDEVFAKKGDKIDYTYDFGDGWEHQVKVEAVENGSIPEKVVCIKGERACPPEDCGGVWGYAEKLDILQDPKHPDYEDYREWMGEDFDPEYFDIEEVNNQLKQMVAG